MRFASYRVEGNLTTRVGIMYPEDDRMYDISLYDFDFQDMISLIENISPARLHALKEMSKPSKGYLEPESYVIAAPIPFPRQDIICLGLNYMDHAAETGYLKKADYKTQFPYAVYFSKRVNEAVGDNAMIPLHDKIEDFLDYETELAVIIGKTARDVSQEDAPDYIFGYTIINDVSARTIQKRHKQWYLGKSLDGATPMGPYIVTADEIAYPPALALKTYVNGEVRQNNNTANLLFGISHIISELSQGITLLPGTIISTGTPSGVGIAMDPPQNLKRDDVVVCEIEGIGKLTNVVY